MASRNRFTSSAGSASPRPSLSVIERFVRDLHPDPRNARQHSRRQLRHLAQSISAFGFNVPVLIDEKDRVLAGHARLLAAKELGIEQVPTIRLEHLSPDQARAFQIADNRLTELSTWDEPLLVETLQALTAVDLDFNIEATGFSVGEIDLRIETAVPHEELDPADTLPALSDTVVSVPGDLWQLGDHRLLCGNALEGASYEVLMAGARAAMVFTDPPYNVPIDGFAGGNGRARHREFLMASGEMSATEFTHFLGTAFGHLVDASLDGALAYVCMDWRHLGEMLAAAQGRFAELKNLCVWAKDRAGMGSFYRAQHELVFVFKAGPGRARNNIELGRNGRHRSNVWQYPSVLNSRHGEEGDLLALHPTVKPIRLVADAILDASARREIVLDPFLGSGTTLMACQRVGRICHGIELDPRYVDVAVRRWQRDSGDDARHVASGQTFAEREKEMAICPDGEPARHRRGRKEVGHG